MNIDTGEIVEGTDDLMQKMKEGLLTTEEYAEISEKDMTDDQRKTKQVDLDDNESKLGKLRHTLINTRQARRLEDQQQRKNPIVKDKKYKYVKKSRSKYIPEVEDVKHSKEEV